MFLMTKTHYLQKKNKQRNQEEASVITMKAQQRMQATAEARKPDSCVTAGIASIPAPT